MSGPVEWIETISRRTMVIARSLENTAGIAAKLFSQLGAGGFNIEMISETGVSGDKANISFVLAEEDAEKAMEYLKSCAQIKVGELSAVGGMGILTVYGKALIHEPGIAGKVFTVLADEGINIEMISTSLASISVLIKEEYLEPAKNMLIQELKVNA